MMTVKSIWKIILHPKRFMKLLVHAVCYLLFVMPCFAQQKSIYLTPENALGIKASHLFSEINIIPLETTQESYFNNMADFLITPDRLVFTDNQSNSILIYDKQGKFLHRYKKRKYEIGPLQYIYSKNAVFFTSSNKNYTIPFAKKQQMMYKSETRDFSRYENIELLYLGEGEQYRIEKLPVPQYALNGVYYVNGRYLQQTSRYNKYVKDTVLYHANLIKDNGKTTSYFPFLNLPNLFTDYTDIRCNIDRTLNDSIFYIKKDYDNTIYRLVNDSIQEAYRFVFPATQTMPADFYTTAFKNNIDFENYKSKNGKAVKSFFNIVDLKEALFFGMNDNQWNYKRYVFNKHSSMLYDLSKITTDSSVYYMPTKVFSKLNNYDESYIYTYISSDDLLKEKANILAKYKNEVPSQLLKIFEGLTRFHNPIIIQLKIKPNLNTK